MTLSTMLTIIFNLHFYFFSLLFILEASQIVIADGEGKKIIKDESQIWGLSKRVDTFERNRYGEKINSSVLKMLMFEIPIPHPSG